MEKHEQFSKAKEAFRERLTFFTDTGEESVEPHPSLVDASLFFKENIIPKKELPTDITHKEIDPNVVYNLSLDKETRRITGQEITNIISKFMIVSAEARLKRDDMNMDFVLIFFKFKDFPYPIPFVGMPSGPGEDTFTLHVFKHTDLKPIISIENLEKIDIVITSSIRKLKREVNARRNAMDNFNDVQETLDLDTI